jgi:long-chain acyl-CoA synthetase
LTGELADMLVAALRRHDARVAGPNGRIWRSAALLSLAQSTVDRLMALGVQPAEPVLVTIGNRPEDLGVLLGVWLAGAAAVPVHRSAAASTISTLQQTTQARFSIDAAELAQVACAAPQRRDLLSDAALVLFTSGSTGQPKGVVLGHTQLAGKLAVLDRLLELRADDVVIVPLQLTFVFGIWVSLLALLAGARLILVARFSREAVAEQLGRGATILAAVPSMLRMLTAERPIVAPALRAIFSGGEPLGTALPGAIADAWPNAGIFDLYGLTETGSCDFCLTPSDLPQGLGTIGFPTEQVGYRLIAENGAVADVGRPGELQIATPFGMLGYLDDPALTEASFSEQFFRTGDLARLRDDGRVELVGRIKAIISRGGNKIAPLEIENLFGSHPDVVGVLCTGIADARLGETVHVMVVPRAGVALDAEALRRWAAARTEPYKLPDGIHCAAGLPIGPTGKADRAALARMITKTLHDPRREE